MHLISRFVLFVMRYPGVVVFGNGRMGQAAGGSISLFGMCDGERSWQKKRRPVGSGRRDLAVQSLWFTR